MAHPSLIIFERFLTKMIHIIGSFFVLVFILYFIVISRGEVNGPSMQPTFVDQEHFFINKIHYLFSKPKRFDVVQTIDLEHEKYILKRVIGLPHETILIQNGKVFLVLAQQGNVPSSPIPIDERSYLAETVSTKPAFGLDPYKSQTITAGADEYIVLGDNRSGSTDSRSYGPLPRSKIIGKVIKN